MNTETVKEEFGYSGQSQQWKQGFDALLRHLPSLTFEKESIEVLESLLGAFGYLALTDPPGRWPEIEKAQLLLKKLKGEQ
jgi:nicotinic acid phosphoribosyltransferase